MPDKEESKITKKYTVMISLIVGSAVISGYLVYESTQTEWFDVTGKKLVSVEIGQSGWVNEKYDTGLNKYQWGFNNTQLNQMAKHYIDNKIPVKVYLDGNQTRDPQDVINSVKSQYEIADPTFFGELTLVCNDGSEIPLSKADRTTDVLLCPQDVE